MIIKGCSSVTVGAKVSHFAVYFFNCLLKCYNSFDCYNGIIVIKPILIKKGVNEKVQFNLKC